MTRRFTRAPHYHLVWSEPLSTLAPRFGMLGVALAKAGRAAGIPVPEPGHWARTRAGHPVRRRPLAPRAPGTPAPVFEEGDAELTVRVQAMLGKVSVPRALDRPHRLIAELLAEDEARLEKRARAAHPSILDAPTFDTPLERWRLRLLNGPFPALGRAGGKPSLNRAGRDGRVQVGQSSVPVVLERIAASPRTRPGFPTPKTTETIAGDGGSGPGAAGRRWCPDRGPRGDHRRGHHGRGRSAPPP